MYPYYHSTLEFSGRRNKVFMLFSLISMFAFPVWAEELCGLQSREACISTLANSHDYQKLYKVFITSALAGDADSEMNIAFLIVNGKGNHLIENATETQRDELALPWIRLAAIDGSPEAIEWLAESYMNGWFTLPKRPEMSTCLTNAAANKSSILVCGK